VVTKPDKAEVRRWLRGHKAAERVIERERAQELARMTPEESLRIYLKLKEAAPDDPNAGPSPMLMAVRRILNRHAEMKGSGK